MELEYHYKGIAWVIVWDSNAAIDIEEWSICGGGRLDLERFLLVYAALKYHVHSEYSC